MSFRTRSKTITLREIIKASSCVVGVLMFVSFRESNHVFNRRKLQGYINYAHVQDPRTIQAKMNQMQLQTTESYQISKMMSTRQSIIPEATDKNLSATEMQSTLNLIDGDEN